MRSLVHARSGLVVLMRKVGGILHVYFVMCMDTTAMDILHVNKVGGVAADPCQWYQQSDEEGTILFVCKMALEIIRHTGCGRVGGPMFPVQRVQRVATQPCQLDHGAFPSYHQWRVAWKPPRISPPAHTRTFATRRSSSSLTNVTRGGGSLT